MARVGIAWFCVALFGVCAFSSVAAAREVIYFTEEATGRIMACELDGSHPRTVLETGHAVRGLAVDQQAALMYWAQFDTGEIRSASLDGSDLRTIAGGLTGLADLALDSVNGCLYVSDYTSGLIKRVSLSDGSAQTIIDTAGCPYGIAYDAGEIYWADWYWLHGYVQRADADGSDVRTLAVTPGLQTVAVIGEQVFFSQVNDDVIYRMNKDGSGLSIFVDAVNAWGMVQAEGKLFWASQNEALNAEVGGRLQYAPLAGGPVQTILVDDVRPWDLAIVDVSYGVPEPAALALMLAGPALLAGRRRRHAAK